MDEGHDPGEEDELIPRMPELEDLVDLCRELNAREVRYLVVGGFAVISAGHLRTTEDIDLIIDTSPENESSTFAALETLPDKAAKELDPGDVSKFTVVRVNDEFTVDLMASACGIGYEEASRDQIVRTIRGVPIPFASPRMLWRMKKATRREKDIPDLVFLKREYADQIDPS